ncbi:MAG: C1 family peptidase [Sumerlaeia bacterium]
MAAKKPSVKKSRGGKDAKPAASRGKNSAGDSPSAPPVERMMNVVPDTLDFRDRLFERSLVHVPSEIDLPLWKAHNVPILDQGTEGACTGFALATVVHQQMRTRLPRPDAEHVSPRMLYEMARRYDEWQGEDYEGSSARGAMKGWQKHGVCRKDLWEADAADNTLSAARAQDAARRPLGAYFRVPHQDLVAMHCAIAETGSIYATSSVHRGWNQVSADNSKIQPHEQIIGAHAYVIVGYTSEGFWIQNSWGKAWGGGGYALLTYDDWLANAMDAWVARMGVFVKLERPLSVARLMTTAGGTTEGYSTAELAPHIVSIGNDGRLRQGGQFGTGEAEVRNLVSQSLPQATGNWTKKRLLFYAHGGLVSEKSAIERVAEYRQALLKNEVYPLSFIWKSDFWTTITNILQDAFSRRRPEGFLSGAWDFMIDRFDDFLEPVAKNLGGEQVWGEMKENAIRATSLESGGARFFLDEFAKLVNQDASYEVHIAGHSAGSVFMGPFVSYLATEGRIGKGPLRGKTGLGIPVKSVTLWAAACTIELFHETYAPLLRSGQIEHLTLFNLTDDAEQDDHCSRIYNKSLLYLVSNACEKSRRTPLLGMMRYVEKDSGLKAFIRSGKVSVITSPNKEPKRSRDASQATSHGAFDDDKDGAVSATLARILGAASVPKDEVKMAPSQDHLKRRRLQAQESAFQEK